MDSTTIVTRLNELTDFMNKIKTLSKKIFQLPSATDGTKYVAVYNEVSQVTEKFNLSDALSVSNNLSSKINALGTISRVDNTFTFSVGYQWTINNINYENDVEFEVEILEAASGNYRNDIIVLDTNNTFVKIIGSESTEVAQQPPTPPNTLLLCVFDIAGDVINNPNTNTNERQVKKINSSSDYTLIQSDTTKFLLIETEFDLVLPLNFTDNSEFVIKNISGTSREIIFDTGIEFKGNPIIENNALCFLKKIDFDGTNEIYSVNSISQSSINNLQNVTDIGNTTTNSINANGLYVDEINGIGITEDGTGVFVNEIILFKSLSELNKLSQFKASFKTKGDTYQLPDKSGFIALSHESLYRYSIVTNLDAVTFSWSGKIPVLSGTNITRAWASTNHFTKQNRVGFSSGASAGGVCSLRQIGGYFSMGDNFYYTTFFGSSTNSNLSGVRAFVGLTFSNNTTGNVEQDTMINSIGATRLSSSNNWWFMHNDASGVATKIDTGFLANTVDTHWFRLDIINLVGTGLIYVVTNMITNEESTQLITTDLPASTIPLTQRVFVTNNANASQVVLDWGGSTLNA